MSDSNRGLRLALGGIALAAVALIAWGSLSLLGYESEHREQREHAAQYDAPEARQQAKLTCAPISRGSRVFECSADVPAADTSDPYAEDDLRAQQDMAKWALAVAFISLGTLALTGVGVWLLWWTLEATRAAVKAATDANQGFAEASEREQRAYVTALEPSVRPATNGQWLDFGVENGGKTPAYNVQMHVTWISVDDLPESFLFLDSLSEGALPRASYPMGPGQKRLLKSFFMPSGIMFDLNFFIWGWVEYNDIFDGTPRRRTEFCYKVLPVRDDGRNHFEARTYSRYNNTDEYCRYTPETPKGRPPRK